MRSIFAEERLTGSEKNEFLSATNEDQEQVQKRRVVAPKGASDAALTAKNRPIGAGHFILVVPAGLEPATQGSSGLCSTN